MTRAKLLLPALAALALVAHAAAAQAPREPVQTEIRADAIVARSTAVQGGVGISFPAGVYVRTGAVVAAGGGGNGFTSRLDLFSRFSLDPFRESRWGLYGGGGISGRYDSGDDHSAHAYLLVFTGVEGPLRHRSAAGWVPAFEVGLGGGLRVGIALRQGIPGRR